MSSSLSSRASLPATSALVIAVSTIRSVEDRISSRAFIAVVRSARSRSFSESCSAIVAALPHESRPDSVRTVAGGGRSPARGSRRTPRGRRGRFTLREVTVPLLPPGQRPLRVLHLSDMHLTPGQARKQEWLPGSPGSDPTWWSTPATTSPTATRSPAAPESLGDCSTCPGSSSSAPTTTTRRPCATRCATCCPTTASGTPTARSCPWRELQRCSRRGGLDRPHQPARRRSRSGETRFALRRRRRPAPRATTGSTRWPVRPTRTPTCGSAVAHAPYLRVLDQFAADGYDAIWPATPTAARCACRASAP